MFKNTGMFVQSQKTLRDVGFHIIEPQNKLRQSNLLNWSILKKYPTNQFQLSWLAIEQFNLIIHRTLISTT